MKRGISFFFFFYIIPSWLYEFRSVVSVALPNSHAEKLSSGRETRSTVYNDVPCSNAGRDELRGSGADLQVSPDFSQLANADPLNPAAISVPSRVVVRKTAAFREGREPSQTFSKGFPSSRARSRSTHPVRCCPRYRVTTYNWIERLTAPDPAAGCKSLRLLDPGRGPASLVGED